MATAGQEGDERLRLAGDLRLPDDASGRVEDAHAARRQRHVDPRVVVHGRSSLRCRGAPGLGPYRQTGSRRLPEEPRPDYRISGGGPSPSRTCGARCGTSSPTTTPPGSSPATATAPRTRSAPISKGFIGPTRPTYPWPPDNAVGRLSNRAHYTGLE